MIKGRSCVFGVSLRLFDDRRDVAGLLRAWGIDAQHSWLAGELRATPARRLLTGTHPESYAVGKLSIPDDAALAECLEIALVRIESFATPLSEFVEGGGRAQLFVGWAINGNTGDELDWRLLRRLSGFKLTLSLDIYPEARADLGGAVYDQA